MNCYVCCTFWNSHIFKVLDHSKYSWFMTILSFYKPERLQKKLFCCLETYSKYYIIQEIGFIQELFNSGIFNITWHLTPDSWHLTPDICHMTHRGWWKLSQKVSSLALMVSEWRCFEEIITKDQYLNEWMNNKGVHRAALATWGLSKSYLLLS